MPSGREIEAARCAANLSILFMCTALDLDTPEEYSRLVSGRLALSAYQQIMLLIALENFPTAMRILQGITDDE